MNGTIKTAPNQSYFKDGKLIWRAIWRHNGHMQYLEWHTTKQTEYYIL